MKTTTLCFVLLASLPVAASSPLPEALQSSDDERTVIRPSSQAMAHKDAPCVRYRLEPDTHYMARIERQAKRSNTGVVWVNAPKRRVCAERAVADGLSARSGPPRTSPDA